ncbi:hypothetical protein F443_21264 [Phytophthora nicotianae P1569]|uniref:Uncharacterized protein n=1 Tax=Phytophthora nicotianae P1569 TaxID=1317065 RepID=V9E010_PHYNI|nr:hypothetical protein F443_21264 [Phytophthora nicotianae P1569]
MPTVKFSDNQSLLLLELELLMPDDESRSKLHESSDTECAAD